MFGWNLEVQGLGFWCRALPRADCNLDRKCASKAFIRKSPKELASA